MDNVKKLVKKFQVISLTIDYQRMLITMILFNSKITNYSYLLF